MYVVHVFHMSKYYVDDFENKYMHAKKQLRNYYIVSLH